MRVIRGLLAFICFVFAFVVMAFVIEMLFGLASAVSGGWPQNWSRVLAAALGGFIGVGAGKVLLDSVFKKYPARTISAVFIVANVALVLANALIVKDADLQQTSLVQGVRAVTAVLACLYLFWIVRSPTRGRPA